MVSARTFRAVVALIAGLLIGLPATAQAIEITEFYGHYGAEDIALGPDGNLWVTSDVTGMIERVTYDDRVTGQFWSNPAIPRAASYAITSGPDGAMWFCEDAATVGRITMSGVSTHVPVAARALDITTGPDGNLWVTEPSVNKIGRITPGGSVTEFAAGGTSPQRIVTGPDGNLWYTLAGGGIGRMTPSGSATVFPTAAPGADIAVGADGNLWVTAPGPNWILRMSIAGLEIGRFSDGINSGKPTRITAGPDGNLWYADIVTNRISRLTPSGRITSYGAGTNPFGYMIGLAPGPDGTVWYVNYNHAIGRVTLDRGEVTTGDAADLTTRSARITGLAAPNSSPLSVWFEYGLTTNYGSTTPTRSLPDTAPASPVDATVGNLPAGTTYHYRLVGTGPLGKMTGEDHTFTTAALPPAPPPPDADGDGFPETVDCNDRNAGIHTGAPDRPQNGIDEDCSGTDADFGVLPSRISANIRAHRRFDSFKSLALSAPRTGSSVRLSCMKGCRYKTRTVKVTRDAATLSLLKFVRRLKLPAGAVFEVRVTHPDLVGVVRRWRVKSLSNVVTSDLCMRPNTPKPGKCPF